MKRTELKRYARLKTYARLPRSTKPLKRTRLKRESKDERKRKRDAKPERDAYRREFPKCQCDHDCGQVASEIHEILAGAQHRRKAYQSRACWLHLTASCHRRMQGSPYAPQLACKLAFDPEGFCLREVLSILGRVPTAILIEEITIHLPKHLPSADDARLTREHWSRKVELLKRQLADAEVHLQSAVVAHQKAEARERKIRESRLTEG